MFYPVILMRCVRYRVSLHLAGLQWRKITLVAFLSVTHHSTIPILEIYVRSSQNCVFPAYRIPGYYAKAMGKPANVEESDPLSTDEVP